MPLIPLGFNIAEEYYSVDNLTIMFEWAEPQGSGPKAIVDNYTIAIFPMPLEPYAINVLPNFPRKFNVTLRYNIIYTAMITAENCAGESETFVYPGIIEYGKGNLIISSVREKIKHHHVHIPCSQLWCS